MPSLPQLPQPGQIEEETPAETSKPPSEEGSVVESESNVVEGEKNVVEGEGNALPNLPSPASTDAPAVPEAPTAEPITAEPITAEAPAVEEPKIPSPAPQTEPVVAPEIVKPSAADDEGWEEEQDENDVILQGTVQKQGLPLNQGSFTSTPQPMEVDSQQAGTFRFLIFLLSFSFFFFFLDELTPPPLLYSSFACVF